MESFDLEKIKKRIDLSGLKKKHLAKQWNISDARLSQYLSGNYNIPEYIQLKMKKTFGL